MVQFDTYYYSISPILWLFPPILNYTSPATLHQVPLPPLSLGGSRHLVKRCRTNPATLTKKPQKKCRKQITHTDTILALMAGF